MGDFLKAILAFVLLGIALYILFYVGIVILAIGLVIGFLAYAVAFWNTRFRRKNGLEGELPPEGQKEGFIEVEYTEVRQEKTDKSSP